MDKDLGDMTSYCTYSLKLKNKLKLKRVAVKNEMKLSPFLNKLIEEIDE